MTHLIVPVFQAITDDSRALDRGFSCDRLFSDYSSCGGDWKNEARLRNAEARSQFIRMQSVIALCHFCEKHGPRIVVTCQPMRSLPRTVTSPIPGGYDRSSEAYNFPSTSSEPELLPVCYGDYIGVHRDVDVRCGACTSLGNQQWLLSNDHQDKTSYVTSQTAIIEEVHKRMLKACSRSLTCEMAVPTIEEHDHRTAGIRINSANDALPDMEKIKEEEGHVSFGDSEMGMCLAYRFRIHDSKARGRKRLFSLLIMTQDAANLTIHHDFFLEALRRMKDLLQMRAYEIFQTETAGTITIPHHHNASVNISQFNELIREKVQIDPTRTLQILTGTDEIFSDLHRCMMWTLRTQTMRFEDQLMGGQPTQDMLVLMEMDHSEIVELDLNHPNQAELTLQQLKNLRHISQDLRRQDALDLMVVHVITGGQLVAQGSNKIQIKQFLLAISNLLPIGCLRINKCTDRHHEPQRFNLMGCMAPFTIPKTVFRVKIISEKEEEEELEKCSFEVMDRPDMPTKLPKLLARYRNLLLDEEINVKTLKAAMQEARETWLNRAKLLYQLEQQMLQDPKFRANIRGDPLKFVPQCTENERAMLKFWQNGLAVAFRTYAKEIVMEHMARRGV